MPLLTDNPLRLTNRRAGAPLEAVLTSPASPAWTDSLGGVPAVGLPALLVRFRDPVQRTAWRLAWLDNDPDEDQELLIGGWLYFVLHSDVDGLRALHERWLAGLANRAPRERAARCLRDEGAWEGALDEGFRRFQALFVESLYRVAARDFQAGNEGHARRLVKTLVHLWSRPEDDLPARRGLRGCGLLQHRLEPFVPPAVPERELWRRRSLSLLRNYNAAGTAWLDCSQIRYLAREGRQDEALKLAVTARAQHPRSSTLLQLEGALAGDLEKIAASLEAASLDPESWTQRAEMAGDDDAERERCYQRVLELDPLDADAERALGLLAATRNDFQTARDRLERSLELDPEAAPTWYFYGLVLGDHRAPSEHVREALEQAARRGHEKAREMLSQ